jgi:protein-tyrosine phosphatase
MKILFVCLGNICRSPVLEAVLREQVRRAGRQGWHIASCGTGGWHAGEGADPRSCASAARRGYSLQTHRARQLRTADFSDFDWLLAADNDNLAEINRRRPAGTTAQVRLALAFAGLSSPQEVPDPYYGDAAGFDRVIDLAESFALRLLGRDA